MGKYLSNAEVFVAEEEIRYEDTEWAAEFAKFSNKLDWANNAVNSKAVFRGYTASRLSEALYVANKMAKKCRDNGDRKGMGAWYDLKDQTMDTLRRLGVLPCGFHCFIYGRSWNSDLCEWEEEYRSMNCYYFGRHSFHWDGGSPLKGVPYIGDIEGWIPSKCLSDMSSTTARKILLTFLRRG